MNDAERPDPEILLARAKNEAAREARGRFKVFLGASPGVGKTYAMLEAARVRFGEGWDVQIGVIETHGRVETEALAQGLERMPLRPVEYGGLTLRELDLDACIARHPRLLLIDELAHTNAPGSRHTKRWQDVLELLDAGIDVYTTVNIQHVESLNDVVLQITAVRVRETVPDRVLESADEMELVDLPPDELTKRLRAGKVYLGEQAAHAEDNFFREGNLIALRELALRFTAQRVDAQMESYRRERGIESPWPAAERLMVCIGSSPRSSGLLRAARRMASALRTPWYAVVVETPGMRTLSRNDRERLEAHIRQAEEMGAEAVRLSGENVAHELLAFARRKNIARVLIGKPTHSRLRDRLRGSLLDALVRGSAGLEVHVVDATEVRSEAVEAPHREHAGVRSYLEAAACVLIATALGSLIRGRLDLADIAMLYVLGIVVASLRTSLGPSVLASFLSILSYDFVFIPPYYTFAVDDLKHVLSFGVMLWVGLVISTLVARIRSEVEATRDRARRMAELYALSRELGSIAGRAGIADNLSSRLHELFPLEVAVLVPDAEGRLEAAGASEPDFVRDPKERSVAQWAFDLERRAGRGTETLAGSRGLYLPMPGTHGVVGVLAVRALDPSGPQGTLDISLLLPFAQLGALALERARLSEEARRSQLAVETETLRSSLLSSVSHDLRTPLAVISTAAGSLLAPGAELSDAARHELLSDIHAEASRLSRLIENLLDMTRVEAGGLELRKEWSAWEEIVGSALARVERQLVDRPVEVSLPRDLPLILVDGMLMETVLVNLLENALRYTPPRTPIEIRASAGATEIELRVEDRGPGIEAGAEALVFDRFHRGSTQGRGFGLGLAIVKGIVEAHGGSVTAENREDGGASFRIVLPRMEPPKEAPREEGSLEDAESGDPQPERA